MAAGLSVLHDRQLALRRGAVNFSQFLTLFEALLFHFHCNFQSLLIVFQRSKLQTAKVSPRALAVAVRGRTERVFAGVHEKFESGATGRLAGLPDAGFEVSTRNRCAIAKAT